MIQISDIIEIGSFTKTHGIKGELNTFVKDDCNILNECSCIILSIDSIFVPHFIKSIRVKGASSALVMLDDITNEIEAKKLVSKSIYILKEEYNEYYSIDSENQQGGYASDFIGYNIIDDSDNLIGKIIDIDASTDNPLFIVENNDKICYIPIAEEFIIYINDNEKSIGVSLPIGLLDIN